MNSKSPSQVAIYRPLGLSGVSVYQIRVKSCLDDHWADWFEGMDLTRDEARNTTTLTGALPDQAALHGIRRQRPPISAHRILTHASLVAQGTNQ